MIFDYILSCFIIDVYIYIYIYQGGPGSFRFETIRGAVGFTRFGSRGSPGSPGWPVRADRFLISFSHRIENMSHYAYLS